MEVHSIKLFLKMKLNVFSWKNIYLNFTWQKENEKARGGSAGCGVSGGATVGDCKGAARRRGRVGGEGVSKGVGGGEVKKKTAVALQQGAVKVVIEKMAVVVGKWCGCSGCMVDGLGWSNWT